MCAVSWFFAANERANNTLQSNGKLTLVSLVYLTLGLVAFVMLVRPPGKKYKEIIL